MVFIPRAQHHAQSLFLFPIVIGINIVLVSDLQQRRRLYIRFEPSGHSFKIYMNNNNINEAKNMPCFKGRCNAVALLSRRIYTEEISTASMSAFTACRLIALDKNPGVCPIGLAEVLRRIVGQSYAVCHQAQHLVGCRYHPAVCRPRWWL